MKVSQFKEDQKLASEGVVRKLDGDKCYVRVARANNEKFERELRKLMEPFKGFRRRNVPEAQLDDIACRAMAKHILLEMVGFEDDLGDITGREGGPIEDTEENRYKVLRHKAYKDFREFVAQISSDHANFLLEADEEQLGESSATSDGAGRGAENSTS